MQKEWVSRHMTDMCYKPTGFDIATWYANEPEPMSALFFWYPCLLPLRAEPYGRHERQSNYRVRETGGHRTEGENNNEVEGAARDERHVRTRISQTVKLTIGGVAVTDAWRCVRGTAGHSWQKLCVVSARALRVLASRCTQTCTPEPCA